MQKKKIKGEGVGMSNVLFLNKKSEDAAQTPPLKNLAEAANRAVAELRSVRKNKGEFILCYSNDLIQYKLIGVSNLDMKVKLIQALLLDIPLEILAHLMDEIIEKRSTGE